MSGYRFTEWLESESGQSYLDAVEQAGWGPSEEDWAEYMAHRMEDARPLNADQSDNEACGMWCESDVESLADRCSKARCRGEAPFRANQPQGNQAGH